MKLAVVELISGVIVGWPETQDHGYQLRDTHQQKSLSAGKDLTEVRFGLVWRTKK